MRSASAFADGNDVLGLALGAGVTGLVFREQFGGLFLEAAGVVEFGLDAVAAMIERLQHRAVDAEIGEHAHQDDEGDGDPEFRFGEHRSYPFKDASTALSTDLPSGDTPVSRCTMAAAASAAMPRTLLIAASRVEAMVFSASASLSDSRSSSVLRSASDCRVELFAGLGADRLRAGARRGEFAFIGLQRGVGGVLQLLRLGQIAIDRVLTRVEQAADARQRNSRDDQIKRDERDQQRHQLRSKGVLLERRKRRLVAAIRLGVGGRALGVAMTFSHGLLLFGQSRFGPWISSARSVMDQSANSSSSAISSEKMPSASVTAKPKIRLPNWPCAADGLRTAAAR